MWCKFTRSARSSLLDSGIFTLVGEIEGDFDFSDYIEPVINYYTIDGQVNSVPFNSSSPILYTNKTLMEQAGLDPESPPETYGEVMAACETIAASDVSADCFGVSLNGWFFKQWLAQQNAPLLTNDNGRGDRATEANLTSDAFKNIATVASRYLTSCGTTALASRRFLERWCDSTMS